MPGPGLPLDELFQLRGKSEYSLGPIRRLLSLLGNPQHHPKIIHVAGTNGKGSTLVALEALLLGHGFSVGLTTSPHLVRLNERYRLSGQPCTDAQLWAAYETVCQAIGMDPEHPKSELERLGQPYSFFEISIAMAFVIFREAKVEWMLLETGLGGRLDATNVIESPLVLILTRVGRDHMEMLGQTLEEIALEKLAIAKGQAPFVIAEQRPKVQTLAENWLGQRKIPFVRAGQEYGWEGTEFCYQPDVWRVDLPNIGLQGAYQRENLASALAAYCLLFPAKQRLEAARVQEIVSRLTWPGRMEWVRENLLLEGAHNPDGLSALVNWLLREGPRLPQPLVVAMGMMAGKELPPAFQQLQGLNLRMQPLDFAMPGALSGMELQQRLQTLGLSTLPPQSLDSFLAQWPEQGGLAVLSGSLYLIGQAKALLESEKARQS